MGREEVTTMDSVTLLVRSALVAAAVAAATVVVAPGAGAQEVGPDQGGFRDNVVVLSGRAEIRERETVNTVFVADGSAVVAGRVEDALIVLNGNAVISGTVEQDVVVLDGRVRITDTGHVEGDVLSRHRPVVESGGRLDGDFERWNPGSFNRAVALVSRLALWLAVTISTLVLGLLLGLLFPRVVAASDGVARTRLGPVIGWGLALTIGLPIAALIAMATLVGLPLGLVVLLALGLIYEVGYAMGAWILGRTVAKGARPWLAFLAGWGILRVLALIPILGGLVWFATVVVGLGSLAVAAWRTRGGAGPAATEAELAPPAAEPPAAEPAMVAAPPAGAAAAGPPRDEPTAGGPAGDEPTAPAPSRDEPTAGGPAGDERTAPAPPGDQPPAGGPPGDQPPPASPPPGGDTPPARPSDPAQ
jgi:hypothetical protein